MATLRRLFASKPEMLFKTSQPGPLRFVRLFSGCLLLEPWFMLFPGLLSYGMEEATLGELGLYMCVNGVVFMGFYVRGN